MMSSVSIRTTRWGICCSACWPMGFVLAPAVICPLCHVLAALAGLRLSHNRCSAVVILHHPPPSPAQCGAQVDLLHVLAQWASICMPSHLHSYRMTMACIYMAQECTHPPSRSVTCLKNPDSTQRACLRMPHVRPSRHGLHSHSEDRKKPFNNRQCMEVADMYEAF